MTSQEWGLAAAYLMLLAFGGWALWASRPAASARRSRTHTRHAHGGR